jgi:hypothetical protein
MPYLFPSIHRKSCNSKWRVPLIIDQGRNITEDEEGIVLALEQRDRVRRVRL